MWREASNEQDALLIIEVAELCEPKYYGVTGTKGALEHKKQSLLSDFNSEQAKYWIYEDGQKRGVIKASKRPNEIGRIEKFIANGFGDDIYSNYKVAFPILMDKVREVMDEWGVSHYYALTPRTINGECLIYFAQAYLWEAEITMMPDGMGWKTEVYRDKSKAPQNEKSYPVIKVPTIDADAVPKDEKLELPK